MILSMLTADAAAKHGHEYCPHRETADTSYASFLMQSPLSILNSVVRRPTARTSDSDSSPAVAKETSMLTESEAFSTPSSDHSRPVSVSSVASTEVKPKRRNPRPKTTYNFAHPPPVTAPRQKLHLKPKTLLQLQQIIPLGRPKPVYEVLSSSVCPRLCRRFARNFMTKDRVSPNDIVIVEAEDYGVKDEEDSSDDENWNAREAIGMILAGRKDEKGACIKTEIMMDDATCWEVTNLPNGGYEFIYVDAHGLPLRCKWIARSTPSRRISGGSMASISASSDDKKFCFSAISPNSRRHPIIATMTRSSIDVSDTYSMPSGSSASPFQSPLPTPLSETSSFMDSADFPQERRPIQTDDTLRKLIVVTGIWVGFCENWSPSYNYTRANSCSSTAVTATNVTSQPKFSLPGRSVSMPTHESFTPGSRSSSPDENRRTIPRLLRARTLHRNSTITIPSVSTPTSASTSPVSENINIGPRRSKTTGTAFYRQDKLSSRKRFGLALQEQTVPESEEERERERSMEIMRKKKASGPQEEHTTTKEIKPTFEDTVLQTAEPSPTLSVGRGSSRDEKAQSAYVPVQTTAGLWDSGTAEKTSKRASLRSEYDNRKKTRKRSEKFTRFIGFFRRHHEG